MRNKRGDEFVEAAMVLPVLILTILSMILLMLFFFTCLKNQTSMHQRMLDYSADSGKTFQLYKDHTETSRRSRGITAMLLHKDMEGRLYVINEADFIRAGELFDLE